VFCQCLSINRTNTPRARLVSPAPAPAPAGVTRTPVAVVEFGILETPGLLESVFFCNPSTDATAGFKARTYAKFLDGELLQVGFFDFLQLQELTTVAREFVCSDGSNISSAFIKPGVLIDGRKVMETVPRYFRCGL